MLNIKKNTNTLEYNEMKIVNQMCLLGIDMIDCAKSGHPGIVLGAAPIIYTLYAKHLRIDPKNPNFFGRDRFIMSAGHGSALLYANLYMAGFNITLDDLKKFRQIDSITPGHPEVGVTPGVDMTTGPLGQGLASAVGMAMGEAHLESIFNVKKNPVIDFYTYVLCSDGDLMEGISYEATSLAGSLNLNKLIVLYDSNNICLDGKTNKTFNDNIKNRFESLNWNYIEVVNGSDIKAIDVAIQEAKKSTSKPTIIEIKTIIGHYSNNEGTNIVHGKPLEDEDIKNISEKLNLRDIPFTLTQDTIDYFQNQINTRNKNLIKKFEDKAKKLELEEQELLNHFINKDYYVDFNDFEYSQLNEVEAPRDTAGLLLNSITINNPLIFGGSADLFGACKNYLKNKEDFSSTNYKGSNIFFGVREHAMGAILNGLALLGFRPYGSTFLSFSDYLKPAMRLACLMNLPVNYIFTHDSISVGEDGPTHQPVEQLAQLRIMPNLEVFRPADANEVIGSFQVIYKTKHPTVLALSRNKLPILSTTSTSLVEKGAYIVKDDERRLDGIILASGEEVHLAIDVADKLLLKGLKIRVVSVVSLNRFLDQPDSYKEEILPLGVKKIVIETSSSFSWNKLVYNDKYLITLDKFGASGKYQDVLKKYGFDATSLEEKIEKLLK